MSARIVLFDLGNVVVDWQPLRLYRQLFATDTEAEQFCRDICNMAWHIEHDRGVSFAENGARLIAKHPEFEAEIRAWRTRWLDMFEGYVPGTPLIMAQLEQKKIPLYGLSNLSHEIAEETFDAFPMIKVLKDVVVSGAEGVIKPDPTIYQIALDRMGNPNPSEVFFIDDSAPNIEAAHALGFKAHHFKHAEGLHAALIEEGLL